MDDFVLGQFIGGVIVTCFSFFLMKDRLMTGVGIGSVITSGIILMRALAGA